MNPLKYKISDFPKDKFTVSCYCYKCQIEQIVDNIRLADSSFEDIQKTLKCPNCGETGLRFSIRLKS